jgi:hypothetical protein
VCLQHDAMNDSGHCLTVLGFMKNQSVTGCSNCREAVKMVLLLPLLIPRMLVIVAALLFMATCSYLGGLGW